MWLVKPRERLTLDIVGVSLPLLGCRIPLNLGVFLVVLWDHALINSVVFDLAPVITTSTLTFRSSLMVLALTLSGSPCCSCGEPLSSSISLDPTATTSMLPNSSNCAWVRLGLLERQCLRSLRGGSWQPAFDGGIRLAVVVTLKDFLSSSENRVEGDAGRLVMWRPWFVFNNS